MKKIINGKLYSTETAKLIAEDWYGGCGDFGAWHEYLYKKKTGEFFLHGEGGAATRYAEWVSQNCRSGGEKIIPYTDDDAREWLEEHGSVDEYVAAFGEVEE